MSKIAQRSNFKARQLAQEWEDMMKRHAKPLDKGAKAKGITRTFSLEMKPSDVEARVRSSFKPKSLMTPGGSTGLAEPKVYTGTKIIGIATMHKSNMIPIFNEEAAVEVAQMRRN